MPINNGWRIGMENGSDSGLKECATLGSERRGMIHCKWRIPIAAEEADHA